MPNKAKTIKTQHGRISLPAFFPDATAGMVRGVDALDLKKSQVKGLVVNVYHLLNSGLIPFIEQTGGIHGFVNWPGPIISDSGGFQIMSLIRQRPSWGKIEKNQITFYSPRQKKKIILTPEKSIKAQLALGSDIVMVLDDCTRPNEPLKEQEKSVQRTIDWAYRSRAVFDRLTKKKKNKPLLFAIVQGGQNKRLRKYCAEELLKIGFDGYGYGGWPVNQKGELLKNILKLTADLLPDSLPKYAMGLGKPEDIVQCVKMGYLLFDCVIPTREARHGRLYCFKKEVPNLEKDFYDYLYINKTAYYRDPRPPSADCSCYTCRHCSRAYLHYLFKQNNPLAIRLTTIHNLFFYSQLIKKLRKINDS